MARDNPETNLIIIRLEADPHGRAVLLGSLILLLVSCLGSMCVSWDNSFLSVKTRVGFQALEGVSLPGTALTLPPTGQVHLLGGNLRRPPHSRHTLGRTAILNLGPLHWKHGVLATGPPGKTSQSRILKFMLQRCGRTGDTVNYSKRCT